VPAALASGGTWLLDREAASGLPHRIAGDEDPDA
jgi:hypothetical protein